MENIKFLNAFDIKNIALNNNIDKKIVSSTNTFQDKTETNGENDEILLELEDETIDEDYKKIVLDKPSLLSLKEKKNKNTKDGKITATRQGFTIGDCWLLSGINALSYTKEGKKLIKSALDYQKNGTMVHLKGAGDYWISNKEFSQMKKNEKFDAAFGDDDMIIFEMAVEKVRADITSGKLMLKNDAPEFFFDDEQYMEMVEKNITSGWHNPDLPNNGISTLEAGLMPELIYWMSGKTGEIAYKTSDKTKLLDNFIKNNNQDYILGASSDKSKKVKDINGKKVSLSGPHAYAVKRADNKTVTVIDPHDSSKEIILSRKTFLGAFNSLEGCDLSDKNETQKYTIETTIESEELDDGAKRDTVRDTEGKILKENTYDKNGNITGYKKYLQSNGKLSKELNYKDGYKISETNYSYDMDGAKLRSNSKTYSKGKLKSNTVTSYYKNGQPSSISKEKFTKDKKVSSYVYKKYNEDGILTSKSTSQTNKDGISGSSEWFIYNDCGILMVSTESVKKKDGSEKSVDKKYDTNGNVIYSEYQYKDKNGNIIKTEIDSDGDGIIDEVK